MKRIKLFSFFILTNFIAANTFAQINHVEPLNWWVGMKNPKLQLLINGVNIGETTPVIDYPGVTIMKVNKGDSGNYLFIDLLIATTAAPGSFDIRFKKQGKEVDTYRYELKRREQDAAQFKGFNSSDAVYLIVPDRFANGDYGNDVVEGMRENKIDRNFPGGRHGGDIRGIINHLDYIKDMGFTAIWPTPMLENDMPAYSYHGYAITNHYRVDPRYGTLEEYQELSNKAKQKGLKLIFDEVLNHTGSNYWWMNDLPFKDWLNFPGKYTSTNHRRTTNQDLYASQYDKDLFNEGWFDKTMPDMNGHNPFMANYLIQNTIWWIETLQLGGVRQDTYGYSDKAFLKEWSCAVMNEYPNFSIMGEEWSTNPLITSYWQSGKKNHDGYDGCLNTVMDFPLQAALLQSLNGDEGESYNAPFTKLYEALANDFVYPNPNQLLLLADNHDMNRLFMQLKQDVALTKMALTYLATIRGIPQLFYGTEILMDNTPNHKNDGLIRSDFPGGWKEDSANGFNGAGLNADQLAVQTYLKQLLNWRKKNPVIANGETLHFAPFEGMYVFFRYNPTKTVMVVMNKNDKAMNVETGRFAEILKGRVHAVNILTGEKMALANSFAVPGKTALVLDIE
ncbi:MAG: glycoside hydrolase family 13 protein [Saprospiraceae bacterium]|nr:glycoside hydrolase family 13 protein [Saprospiraceae bacterium]